MMYVRNPDQWYHVNNIPTDDPDYLLNLNSLLEMGEKLSDWIDNESILDAIKNASWGGSLRFGSSVSGNRMLDPAETKEVGIYIRDDSWFNRSSSIITLEKALDSLYEIRKKTNSSHH